MPSDLQYKDDLRKQRDNWNFIMKQIEQSPNFKTDTNIMNAYERAKQEYDRIIESLQDQSIYNMETKLRCEVVMERGFIPFSIEERLCIML